MFSSSWARVSGKWSRRNRRPRTLLPGSKWYVVTVGPGHSTVSACSFGARFRIAWCARNAVLRCGSNEVRSECKPANGGLHRASLVALLCHGLSFCHGPGSSSRVHVARAVAETER